MDNIKQFINKVLPLFSVTLHLHTDRFGTTSSYFVIQKRHFLFFYYDFTVVYNDGKQWFIKDRFNYYPSKEMTHLLKYGKNNAAPIIY